MFGRKKNEPQPEPQQSKGPRVVKSVLDLSRRPVVEHITYSDGTKKTVRADCND
ncbi:hypothetical protein [Streptomyces nigrescens]|uniref:Uncharacterized protein n=1 Tax=Streptomyces nigrescens TaxID=1920 RepID=A0A640T8J1_STRNI|nr:hypothetical protein [Streptomyces libani]WAT94918.1 hypothetical protein STRLI_000590 [Streptomyces libani subsp. libani]GFE20067.1 hypothetical protein Sliba_05200 [Streptomyces libani subsp. libani]GGV85739.1 hypothetical protein GCM10010500_02730 [Streptomyces libani subsp. libani]